MVIDSIKINYYKSIKEPLVLDMQPINIFIGQNNCGKSNVLDAIAYAVSPDLKKSKYFYAKADIELTIKFTEETVRRHQLPASIGSLQIKEENREIVFANQTLPVKKSLLNILTPKIKRLDEEAFQNFAQIETDYHNLFNFPGFLNKFKDNLQKHFPKISATKNALDINYEHDGLYEGDRRVTIDRLGSGFQRIFTMLLYIFHPEYTIVMIDEPETHLHPAVIKKVLWAMQNSQAGQVIFTTHSPLFIKPITLPQVVRFVKEKNSTKAFSLTQHNLNVQRLIQELNADNLEMFFADKVLLVEGVSDKLIMRGLIDKFYQGDKDIKVIQTHGKGNVKIYVHLLDIYKIPYSIMLDRDATKTQQLRTLMHHMEINLPPLKDEELIKNLKKYSIYILPNGDLEANYPRRYQNEDSKSLNALRAARQIRQSDFDGREMTNLKEIINSL
jgi:predicted ATP-dependent endonuclease of OLD family